MSDPFTPSTPPLDSGAGVADSRDFGREQDPTGGQQEDRSFTGSHEADADADAARRGAADGQDEDGDADADGRQLPGSDLGEGTGSNG